MITDCLDKIQDAEKILIGLGEEFEANDFLNSQPAYVNIMKWLVEQERIDLKPFLSDYYLKKNADWMKALHSIFEAVKDKDYYVITTLQTDLLEKAGFDQERLVMPCANMRKVQCINGCPDSISDLPEAKRIEIMKNLQNQVLPEVEHCRVCGGQMIANSLYTEKYNENGYLEQWTKYRSWLQGTVNKKLLIFELGVNLSYPSVIRLPFEKIAFYNQKATLIRVNEKLYQMSAELGEKGISIANNAIDWLLR